MNYSIGSLIQIKEGYLNDKQKTIIESYIKAYNSFDIKGMIEYVDEEIVFKNISNGNTDLEIKGLKNFKDQTETTKQYFTKGKQTIKSWKFENNRAIINIDYSAVLAVNLPNGMKKGDILNL